MTDQYMGSAYRSDRARDERGLSKRGFVAPGFPVEVSPPAAPPAGPPLAAGAASGAAAGAGLGPALAVGGVALVGLLGGYWATEEVREWKRGFYKPSRVYRGYPAYDPLFSFNQEVDLSRNYLYEGGWLFNEGTDESVGSEGWSNPDWNWAPCDLDCGPADNYSAMLAGAERACPVSCEPIDGFLVFPPFFNSPPEALADFPAATRIQPNHFVGVEGVNDRYVARGTYSKVHSTGAAWSQSTVTLAVPLELEAQPYPYPLGWGTAVAPPGTQPSLDEQLAGFPLPRGKAGVGLSVPFSLRSPFTALRIAPGYGVPVSFPDVVIDPGGPGTDPGSKPDPGGVVVLPPTHPPDFPNDDAEKEQKPWTQRLAHMGFVGINVVTEANDFVQAMYKGLPSQYRSLSASEAAKQPWVVLEDIWDNFEHWNSQKALEGWINNQIEDAIYGRFFGLQSKAQKRLGITAGMARGTRVYRPGGSPVTLPIPQVNVNDDGTFTMSIEDYSVTATIGE